MAVRDSTEGDKGIGERDIAMLAAATVMAAAVETVIAVAAWAVVAKAG